MFIHKIIRKVMGILPISTKTCPFFQKQSEIDNKVHNYQNLTSHTLSVQEHNNKRNLITCIIYAETTDVSCSVNEEITYAYFSTIQVHRKKLLQKQDQRSFLKDPQWKH